MVKYFDFVGKIIRFNEPYPVYKDDNIVGYTKKDDMGVITLHDEKDYFEVSVVSGQYIGYDKLALNLSEVMNSTFIFNKLNDMGKVMINEKEVKFEYI